MTLSRYGDANSALSDTTSVSDARRFDAGRGTESVDLHGHTLLQRRAALALATAARDADELRDLLGMCGLLASGVRNPATADAASAGASV